MNFDTEKIKMPFDPRLNGRMTIDTTTRPLLPTWIWSGVSGRDSSSSCRLLLRPFPSRPPRSLPGRRRCPGRGRRPQNHFRAMSVPSRPRENLRTSPRRRRSSSSSAFRCRVCGVTFALRVPASRFKGHFKTSVILRPWS